MCDCSLFFADNSPLWLLPLDGLQLGAILKTSLANLAADGISIGSVEIHFVNDAQISVFNAKFLGREGPTNILSFPGVEKMPGALFLSAEAWRRECRLYRQRPADYLFFLFAHGFAHLSGLDHGERFDALQNKCFETLLSAAKRLRNLRL